MEKTKFDEAMKMLEDVRQKLNSDTFNLTRDDHDAIDIRLDKLKQFIRQTYKNHSSKDY